MNKAATTVDEYIDSFPKELQTRLQALRKTIRKAAPEAEEGISYGMPSYSYFGALVYFAAHKAHIGFYPVPSAMNEFEKDLAPYAAAKGTAQFRHKEAIPFELVTRIVKFRMEENKQKAEKKKQARKCKNGHTFYKTSDCPTCPVCEATKKPAEGFLSTLSAPARRALEAKGITSVKKLAALSEEQVLAFHGVGPSSILELKKALQAEGMQFQ